MTKIRNATVGETVDSEFLVFTDTRTYLSPVTYHLTDKGRIEFLESPFALKDEIKAMQGRKWHGFIEGDKRKIWSVKNSERNLFQIEALENGNPYEWFEQPVKEFKYPKYGSEGFGYFDLMSQQVHMANVALTYHYQIWGAEMGTGKTLAAIATMMMSGEKGWWWVGPKNSLYAIRQEFEAWGLPEGVVTRMLSYEGLQKTLREWKKGDPAPIGVIYDESQKIKTPNAQRTQAAQRLADSIRTEHGKSGYVIAMTGTPSPKSPGDWWSQCEVVWPGFVREGSRETFEQRMSFFRLKDDLAGHAFNTRIAWRDDETRCDVCGHHFEDGHHTVKEDMGLDRTVTYEDGSVHTIKEVYYQGDVIRQDVTFKIHDFKESFNEVAYLYERLEGLATIVHKRDCMDLPDKIYRKIYCEPSSALKRVASSMMKVAPNVISGLTQLRELSDGFQYREVEDGYQECKACTDGKEIVYYHPDDPDGNITDLEALSPEFTEQLVKEERQCSCCQGTRKVVKYKRITREVPCPKQDVLIDLLEHNEEQARLVVFAGFTGSLDRIVKVAQGQGWDTMRLDGRGWKIERLTGLPNEDGTPKTEIIRLDNPLDYWTAHPERKICFVAHPQSGGVALTLSPRGKLPGAVMCVYYSNDFNAGSRSQSEDRIYRKGMDIVKGAVIVDIIHLPTDERVLKVLKQNRKLELMTMGDFEDLIKVEDE